MSSQTFQSLFPDEFVSHYLNTGKRPDNRSLNEFRPFQLNKDSISTAQGSATVKVGNTIVVCGIKAEISSPDVMAPDCGFLVTNVDLPPHCGDQFKPGPPSLQTQTLSQQITDLVKSANVLNLDSLCITPNESVWVLYADIVCLEYDGSLMDACLGSLMAALTTVKLPKVEVQGGDQVKVLGSWQTLSINRILLSASFCTIGDQIIPDPTLYEEQVGENYTFVMDNQLNNCGFIKLGGKPISKQDLEKTHQLARDRLVEIVKLIK